MHHHGFLALARDYNRRIPLRVLRRLAGIGISKESIARFLVGWDGQRVTIPLYSSAGNVTGFARVKDTLDRSPSPEVIIDGSEAPDLYGLEALAAPVPWLVLVENCLHRLILESQGIRAIAPTGSCLVILPAAAQKLTAVPQVYVCFLPDALGRVAGRRAARLIGRSARVARVPDIVARGDHGMSFGEFVRNSDLLAAAFTLADPPEFLKRRRREALDADERRRIRGALRRARLADIIGSYVGSLTIRGSAVTCRCPFHADDALSLRISSNGTRFRCRRCGRSGDALDFLVGVEEVPYNEAVGLLEWHMGI